MGIPIEFTIVGSTKNKIRNEAGAETGCYTLWQAHTQFGGRISWPSDHGNRLIFGRELADLCMFSWIVGKVYHEIPHASIGQKNFAPPFILLEGLPGRHADRLKRDPLDWFLNANKFASPGEELVLPPWNWLADRGLFLESALATHNTYLRMHPKKCKSALKADGYDPVNRSGPFLWFTCKEAGRWLDELQNGRDHDAQKFLRPDKEARAIVHARAAYIAALGKVNYRIIVTSFGSFQYGSSPVI